MGNEAKRPAPESGPGARVVVPTVPREIASSELLAGAREVRIRHAAELYVLRQTSKGKLILTK